MKPPSDHKILFSFPGPAWSVANAARKDDLAEQMRRRLTGPDGTFGRRYGTPGNSAVFGDGSRAMIETSLGARYSCKCGHRVFVKSRVWACEKCGQAVEILPVLHRIPREKARFYAELDGARIKCLCGLDVTYQTPPYVGEGCAHRCANCDRPAKYPAGSILFLQQKEDRMDTTTCTAQYTEETAEKLTANPYLLVPILARLFEAIEENPREDGHTVINVAEGVQKLCADVARRAHLLAKIADYTADVAKINDVIATNVERQLDRAAQVPHPAPFGKTACCERDVDGDGNCDRHPAGTK